MRDYIVSGIFLLEAVLLACYIQKLRKECGLLTRDFGLPPMKDSTGREVRWE